MTIAGLVLLVLFLVYRTTLAAVDLQDRRRAGSTRAARALDHLSADLRRLLPQPEDAARALQLATNPDNGAVRLEFCAALLEPTADGGNEVTVQRIRYASLPTGGLFRITRAVAALTGPEPPGGPPTNVLVQAAAGFGVALFDGEEWRDQWMGEEAPAPPRAARLSIQLPGAAPGPDMYRTDVFLPASAVVTAAVRQAAAPRPP